jgi:hypothetical protein
MELSEYPMRLQEPMELPDEVLFLLLCYTTQLKTEAISIFQRLLHANYDISMQFFVR